MHSLVKLGFAAALLAGVASPALAEGTKPGVAASTTSTTSADPTMTGSVNLSMDSFLADTSSGTSVDLSGFTSTSTVEFVAVDTLQGWDASGFDAEISRKTADLTSLRSTIEANAVLKAKIEAAGHQVDDVIAIREDPSTKLWDDYSGRMRDSIKDYSCASPVGSGALVAEQKTERAGS